MLIELVEGFFVEPDFVAVVKATGEDRCAIFTPGQSATDGGFTVPYSAAQVAEHVNDAMEEQANPMEDDEGPEDDEETEGDEDDE
jgi:hypothetical protein